MSWQLTDAIAVPVPELFAYAAELSEIEQRFGPAIEYDQLLDGIAEPIHLWPGRFGCGLEVVLRYHTRSRVLEVLSRESDMAHLARHLEIGTRELHHWTSRQPDGRELPTIERGAETWTVWRQDDNGNRAIVAHCHSRLAASCLADLYTARGHKQTYWIERGDTA